MRHRMLRWRIQQASGKRPGYGSESGNNPEREAFGALGDVYLVAINVTAFTGKALPPVTQRGEQRFHRPGFDRQHIGQADFMCVVVGAARPVVDLQLEPHAHGQIAIQADAIAKRSCGGKADGRPLVQVIYLGTPILGITGTSSLDPRTVICTVIFDLLVADRG